MVHVINGTPGNDTLLGSDEADINSGFAGNDLIAGVDFTRMEIDHTTLRPLRANPLRSDGDPSADTLLGGEGNDSLYGGGGPDTLDGGPGNDLLVGGGGPDILTGGPGADRFQFVAKTDANNDAIDHITDFNPAEGDVIDFSQLQGSVKGAVWNGTLGFSTADLLDVTFGVRDGKTHIYWHAGDTVPDLAIVPGKPSFQYGVPTHTPQGEIILDGEFPNLSYKNFDLVPGLDDAHFVEIRPGAEPPLREARPAYAPLVGEVERLYDTFFQRHPDQEGEQFWLHSREAGHSLEEIADRFIFAQEFADTYGQPTNRAYVEHLYTNILDRPGEEAGISFWSRNLDAGDTTRALVAVAFSESEEHVLQLNRSHGFGEWGVGA